MQPKSVLVVEDEALLRNLIANALTNAGYRVAAVGSAAAARAAIEQHHFEAAVLDVDLGAGPNGFEVAQLLRERSPAMAVVFLTGMPDPRFAGHKLPGMSGTVAYLRKSALSDLGQLFDALSATLAGKAGKKHRDDLATNRPLRNLTQNQIEVLALMSEGYSNAQIAQVRGVSVKAVEDTIRRACNALGLESKRDGNVRVAAVRAYLAAIGGTASANSD